MQHSRAWLVAAIVCCLSLPLLAVASFADAAQSGCDSSVEGGRPHSAYLYEVGQPYHSHTPAPVQPRFSPRSVEPSPSPSGLSTATAPVAAAGDGLRFRLLTASAAWEGRAQGALFFLNKSISFTSVETDRRVTFPSGFLVFGGWGSDPPRHNDVWASSDARLWHLISGRTKDGVAAASPDSSFDNGGRGGVLSAMDPRTGNVFHLGGGGVGQYEVWMSTNGVVWRDQQAGTPSPHAIGVYGMLVVNSQGRLVEAAGGDTSGPVVSLFNNDVWTSRDLGKTWRQQTAMAPWPARFVASAMSWQMREETDEQSAVDVMWVIGGNTRVESSNDVWASSDEGRSWALINALGSFNQREGASSLVTRDGLMLVVGGFADDTVGTTPIATTIANDVYVSANGGYTWGRCVKDAEWEDRYTQMTTLDGQGHLLVAGGRTFTGTTFGQPNDVWQSTISFHDLDAVSRVCGVAIPACGVGLRCWPGADTVVATDNSYVSCNACPNPAALTAAGGVDAGSTNSTSSSSTTMLAALVVCILLLVAAAVALMFSMRQVQTLQKTLQASHSNTQTTPAEDGGLTHSLL